MRRLTLVALSAAVLFTACDQSQPPTSPTSGIQELPGPKPPKPPPPPPPVVGTCANPFPDLTPQLQALFGGTPHLKPATDKVKEIQKQCAKGKPHEVRDARHKAFKLVDETLKKYRKGQLRGGAVQLAGFISGLFTAVGLQQQMGTIDPNIFGPKGGVGVYDPDVNDTDPLLVQNQDATAAAQIPAGGFDEATLITIIPLPNTNQLVTNGEAQSPPFYDYNAANESNNHTVNGFAIIGFCVDEAVLGAFNNPRIGHNPLAGGFEVLDVANGEQYESLDLNCFQFGSEGFRLGFGGGLKALAQSLFLPEALHAAAMGQRGLGGLPTSLSPFGVVDATFENSVDNASENNLLGETFTAGQPVDTCDDDGCFPRFLISNGEGFESGTITATLIPMDGSTGTLSGTTSETTTGGSEPSVAEFDNLVVSDPGTYRLSFAAPNATPYVTATFRVASAEVTQLSCEQEGTIKSLESNRAVNLEFTNNTERSVAVYWLNFAGQREFPVPEVGGIGVPYARLAPGESYTQPTYVTHPWLLESDDEAAICYGIFLPGTQDGEVVVP